MKVIRWAFFLLLLSLAGAGGLTYMMGRPYAGFHGETFVEIPKGTSTQQIGEMLAKAGVVRWSWEFWLVRLTMPHRGLQAGEYRFNRPASVFDVYRRIARGDIYFIELLVPEGENMFDIAGSVERLGLCPADEFLAAARDPSMIRDLDPHAPSLEGYLFPDTYRVTRHTKPQQLCHMMTAKFREVWHSLKTDADVHQTVTLASMIEKEGKLAEERPMIAQVFLERLKIGMKLDCDPTTIYAALLDGRYRGTIYRSDLANDNPYNTYRHAGLPPGPIANPGLASIKAVLHPSETSYLYFVARPDGSGGHTFSETIEAHKIAAAKYRHANHEAQVEKTDPDSAPVRKKHNGNRQR